MQQQYLTLDEYRMMAKKCLSKFARNAKQTDDAISYVAYYCMKADEIYNSNIGTRDGFRASYGRFGALKWTSKVMSEKKKHKRTKSLESFKNSIEDKSSLSLSDRTLCKEIIERITSADYLTETQKEIYIGYYRDGYTMQELADKYNYTRANISLIVAKVTEKLKEKFNRRNLNA